MSQTSENTPILTRSLGFPFRARTTSSTTVDLPASHIPRKLNSLFQFNHSKVDDNSNNPSRQLPTPGLEHNYRRGDYSDDEDNYSDNGTVQPGDGQYTLRVINPDPVSSSESEEEKDDDDRERKPAINPPNALPRNATTRSSSSAASRQQQLPLRQFDIAHVQEEQPPLAFVTAFVTTAPSSTASSLSIGSSARQQETGASLSTIRTPEPPSPVLTHVSSTRTVSRRESKTLQEQTAPPSATIDFLPPLDLPPIELARFTRPSTHAATRVVLGPAHEQIIEEDDAEEEEEDHHHHQAEKDVNFIMDEELVQTPLPLSPETTRATTSLYRASLGGGTMQRSEQDPLLETIQEKTELVHTQRPLSPGDSGILSLSLYGNRSVATTTTTDSVSTSTMRSPRSKYAKASYSLTNKRDALKMYRDMAEKTNDPQVQLTYAKYLLEIAPLYVSSRNTSRHGHGKAGSLSLIMGHDIVKRGRAGLNYTSGLLSAGSSPPAAATMDQDEKGKALEEEGVRWIRRLAKQGEAEAAGILASWIDEQKYGFRPNPAKSHSLHEIAARQGRPESIFAVGRYLERQGQSAAALKCYKDASEHGLVAAVQRLALVMIHGQLGQRQNMSSGLDLLAQAAANATPEDPDPLFVFGQVLSNTYPLADIPTELVQAYGGKAAALPAFERAAELGHAGALAQLGTIYQKGLYDVAINLEKSFKYYDMAAKKGNADAMLGMSSLYNGGVRSPDDSPIEQQYRIARDESHWLEQNPLNEDLAFHWCQKAADMNHPGALFLLGWYYETGFGTPRDFGRAHILYEQAASKGQEEATLRLQKVSVARHQTKEQTANGRRVSHDSRRESQTCTIM